LPILDALRSRGEFQYCHCRAVCSQPMQTGRCRRRLLDAFSIFRQLDVQLARRRPFRAWAYFHSGCWWLERLLSWALLGRGLNGTRRAPPLSYSLVAWSRVASVCLPLAHSDTLNQCLLLG
jgi:hypothetical protein